MENCSSRKICWKIVSGKRENQSELQKEKQKKESGMGNENYIRIAEEKYYENNWKIHRKFEIK